MSPVRRIAIVGAESTGKSWLAQTLTEVLTQRGEAVQWVPEALRAWCEREGRTPEPHEQMAIAQAQADAVLSITQGIVVADTTPLMTAVYSHMLFQDESLYPMALAHQQGFLVPVALHELGRRQAAQQGQGLVDIHGETIVPWTSKNNAWSH